MNKGGFSLKTLLGITSAKRKILKKVGVPFSKSGRQRKVGGLVYKLFAWVFK